MDYTHKFNYHSMINKCSLDTRVFNLHDKKIRATYFQSNRYWVETGKCCQLTTLCKIDLLNETNAHVTFKKKYIKISPIKIIMQTYWPLYFQVQMFFIFFYIFSIQSHNKVSVCFNICLFQFHRIALGKLMYIDIILLIFHCKI